MALVNEHFLKLASNYLFADIAKKVKAYKIAHPKQQVISLGIGDVTQPLCPAVIKAMHKAVDEMAVQASFRVMDRKEVMISSVRPLSRTISYLVAFIST